MRLARKLGKLSQQKGKHMLHPDILKMYLFIRSDQQQGAIDACSDTAFNCGIPVASLAQFLRTIGIDVALLWWLIA